MRRISVAVASTAGVAERWIRQYGRGPDKKGIKRALMALPPTATVSDVDKIIGNQSWTHPFCMSCSNYTERAVEFDSGDGSTVVCEQCLDAAKQALTMEER